MTKKSAKKDVIKVDKRAEQTIRKKKKSTRKKREVTVKMINPVLPFTTDALQTKTIISAGKMAGSNAIREAKALGLSITYLQRGILYREKADGTKEKIAGKTKKVNVKKIGNVILKKNMVLHAK